MRTTTPCAMPCDSRMLSGFLRTALAGAGSLVWLLVAGEGLVRVVAPGTSYSSPAAPRISSPAQELSILVGVIAVVVAFQDSIGAGVYACAQSLSGSLIGALCAAPGLAIGSRSPLVLGSALLLLTPLSVVLSWHNPLRQKLAVGLTALLLLLPVLQERQGVVHESLFTVTWHVLLVVCLGCAMGLVAWAILPWVPSADVQGKVSLQAAARAAGLALRVTVAEFEVAAPPPTQSAPPSPTHSTFGSRPEHSSGGQSGSAPTVLSGPPVTLPEPSGQSVGAATLDSSSTAALTTAGLDLEWEAPLAQSSASPAQGPDKAGALPILRKYRERHLAEAKAALAEAATARVFSQWELAAWLHSVRCWAQWACNRCCRCGCACSDCCGGLGVAPPADPREADSKWYLVVQKLYMITLLMGRASEQCRGSQVHALITQGLSPDLLKLAKATAALVRVAVNIELAHSPTAVACCPCCVQPHVVERGGFPAAIQARDDVIRCMAEVLRKFALVRKAVFYGREDALLTQWDTRAVTSTNTVMFGAIRTAQLVVRAAFSPSSVTGGRAPSDASLREFHDRPTGELMGHTAISMPGSQGTQAVPASRGGVQAWLCGVARTTVLSYPAWRRAMKLTLAVFLVALQSLLPTNMRNTHLAPLAVAFAAGSNSGNTFISGLARIQGTMTGGILGFFIVEFAFNSPVAASVLLGCAVGLVYLATCNAGAETRRVALITAFTTVIIVTGVDVRAGAAAAESLAVSRIQQNVFGVLALMLVSMVVLPDRASDALPSQASQAMRGLHTAVKQTAKMLSLTLLDDDEDGSSDGEGEPAAGCSAAPTPKSALPSIRTPSSVEAGRRRRMHAAATARDRFLAMYNFTAPSELDEVTGFTSALPQAIEDAKHDPRIGRTPFPAERWAQVHSSLKAMVSALRLVNQCRITLALQRAQEHHDEAERLKAKLDAASLPTTPAGLGLSTVHLACEELMQVFQAHDVIALREGLELTGHEALRGVEAATARQQGSLSEASPATEGAADLRRDFVFGSVMPNMLQLLEAVACVCEHGAAVLRGDSVSGPAALSRALRQLTMAQALVSERCDALLEEYGSVGQQTIAIVSRWVASAGHSGSTDDLAGLVQEEAGAPPRLDAAHSAPSLDAVSGVSSVATGGTHLKRGVAGLAGRAEVGIRQQLISRLLISNAEAVHFASAVYAMQLLSSGAGSLCEALGHICVHASDRAALDWLEAQQAPSSTSLAAHEQAALHEGQRAGSSTELHVLAFLEH